MSVLCEVRPLNNNMWLASCSHNEQTLNVVIILFQSCSVDSWWKYSQLTDIKEYSDITVLSYAHCLVYIAVKFKW